MSSFKLATLVAAACALHSGHSTAAPVMTGDLALLTVFADTYMEAGQNTQILGNVTSGGVETTGAGSRVVGNVISGGAANVGASIVGGSQTTISVGGFVRSGGLATTGDGSIVNGDITSSGAANVGANASVRGNVVSGDVGTAGANAKISGNFISVGAGTIGDTAKVFGDMAAGGIATVGANGLVGGTVKAGGNAVISASAATGAVSSVTASAGQSTLTASPVQTNLTNGLTGTIMTYVASVAKQVLDMQTSLTNYVAGTAIAQALAATITTDSTLGAGVYTAANLSTTAGTTLFLDAKHQDNQLWIFNIADYIAFGGETKVKIVNGGANERVFWNVGSGYASSGDGAKIVGTILARDYVMVGANSTVKSSDGSCGGVFSQTSYVSTGANAIIGGEGCKSTPGTTATPIPEPATYTLMLAGLGLMVFMIRPKKAKTLSGLQMA